MKLNWKREILALGLLAAMAAVAIHYYSILPDRIPGYWGAHGESRAWSGKSMFFLMWGIYLVLPYLLITFLPFIDPLRRKIAPKFRTLLLVRDLLLVTCAAFFVMNIITAVKGGPKIYWYGVAIGVFLLVYANYLPKIPRNFSVGMKTSWTLSSDIVWKKTQILGGWLIAATGVTITVFALLGADISIPVLAIIPAMAVIRIHSYLTYRKLEKTQTAGKQVV